MKNYIAVLLLIPTMLMGCKKELPKKKSEQNSGAIKNEEIAVQPSNPIFSNSDYKYLYQYSDGESIQLIGINYGSDHTLKFHLVTKTPPCDTEFWGIAENINWNMDPEIDSDPNGAYFADEYFNEEPEYSLAIRIADDSTKVRIKYRQKDGLETDCMPIIRVIMKRIK